MSLLRHGPFGRMRFGAAGSPAPEGHFVSPDGNASWAQAVSLANPCSPATAFANAVAGDTVYFRGGTYTVAASEGNTPSLPEWRPTNSGTAISPIIFRAYPGEIPTVAAAPTVSVTGMRGDICFGVVSRDYVTFDGFTCQGREVNAGDGAGQGQVYLYETLGVVLKNLTLDGGAFEQTGTDNCNLIRIDNSGSFLVQNCLLRNARHVSDYHDTGAFKFYHNSEGYITGGGHGVIEHCEIYDCTGGIFVKSNTDDLEIRYCFLHDLGGQAIEVSPVLEIMESDRGAVHHNLIVNCGFAGFNSNNDGSAYHGNDWAIFHNTFYNTVRGISFSASDAGHGLVVHSNISQGQSENDLCVATANARLAACDHNNWGTGTLALIMRYGAGSATYTAVADWQASSELESGGHPGSYGAESGTELGVDPQFSDGSGTLRLATDFALGAASPCKGAGRAGADMGCDVAAVGVQ